MKWVIPKLFYTRLPLSVINTFIEALQGNGVTIQGSFAKIIASDEIRNNYFAQNEDCGVGPESLTLE